MNPRINYSEQSPELARKLIEFSQAIEKSGLEPSILLFVQMRSSQLNGCAFCFDMEVKKAKLIGERELRVHHVAIWRESPLFSDRERAALEWTEALTRVTPQGVSDETFQRVREHFSEKELSDLSFAIGAINLWNRMNIGFRTVPGTLDKMFGLSKAGLQ